MKFDNFVQPVVNLSDNPSSSLIPKLKKGDVVLYEGVEHTIEMEPQKRQGTKGIWVVGLRNNETDKKFGIRIADSDRPSMTDYEKKVMKRNIRALLKKMKDEEEAIDEERILKIIKTYYWNLAEHNQYEESDVRECMDAFPVELLQKSGIPL